MSVKLKNKLKDQREKSKQEASIYKKPNGPYKTVSFIPLSNAINIEDTISSLLCSQDLEFKESSDVGKLFFSNKHKENYLFLNAQNSDDQEFSYITRSSDILVFLVKKEIKFVEKLRLTKKYFPSSIFCYLEQEDKRLLKDFVKKNFGTDKVVEFSKLLDVIHITKVSRTVACDRPYIIPFKCLKIDDDRFIVEGLLKKGFLTDKLICNGKYEFIIEEVSYENKVIVGKELKTANSLPSETIVSKKEDTMEVEEAFASENENSFEEITDSESTHSSDYESEECNESFEDDDINVLEKYTEYRGIKNLSTCNFISKVYPSNYKQLTFFRNIKDLEKKIKTMKSLIEENKIVSIKLRKNFEGTFQFNSMVLFNLYPFEDVMTIMNFPFKSDIEIKNNQKILIDLGFRVIEACPLITNNSNSNVHKAIDKSTSGTISFITPLTLFFSRMLIFQLEDSDKKVVISTKDVEEEQKANYSLFNNKKLIGSGISCSYDEKVIVEELKLKGFPFKINKKYCTIRKMFRTKDEVLYFRNIDLYTKEQNLGIIKKAIGTHGVFKAYFNRPLKHGDVVLMSLYKRIFPTF